MKALIYILTVVVSLSSCIKPYDDPPIQATGSILVIEGGISDAPPPYNVMLTKSAVYNSPKQTPTPIKFAVISITDNLGHVEKLIEKPQGTYNTSATGMRGIIGNSYKLKVVLPDKNIYESNFVTLNPSPVIDSLYAEKGQLQTLIQQPDGTYIENIALGLNIYANVTPKAGQDYYYKFKGSSIQLIQQTVYLLNKYLPTPGGPPQTYEQYIWNTSILDIQKDLKASTVQNLAPIKRMFVGFVPEFYTLAQDSFHDPERSNGAIVTSEVYSVPKEIYEIYTEENDQGKPTNSLFDPIPTQIESNIVCTSNSSIQVLGYFSAYSIVRKYGYFYWIEGSGIITTKTLDSIPSDIPSSGSIADTAGVGIPNFWIFP